MYIPPTAKSIQVRGQLSLNGNRHFFMQFLVKRTTSFWNTLIQNTTNNNNNIINNNNNNNISSYNTSTKNNIVKSSISHNCDNNSNQKENKNTTLTLHNDNNNNNNSNDEDNNNNNNINNDGDDNNNNDNINTDDITATTATIEAKEKENFTNWNDINYYWSSIGGNYKLYVKFGEETFIQRTSLPTRDPKKFIEKVIGKSVIHNRRDAIEIENEENGFYDIFYIQHNPKRESPSTEPSFPPIVILGTPYNIGGGTKENTADWAKNFSQQLDEMIPNLGGDFLYPMGDEESLKVVFDRVSYKIFAVNCDFLPNGVIPPLVKQHFLKKDVNILDSNFNSTPCLYLFIFLFIELSIKLLISKTFRVYSTYSNDCKKQEI